MQLPPMRGILGEFLRASAVLLLSASCSEAPQDAPASGVGASGSSPGGSGSDGGAVSPGSGGNPAVEPGDPDAGPSGNGGVDGTPGGGSSGETTMGGASAGGNGPGAGGGESSEDGTAGSAPGGAAGMGGQQASEGGAAGAPGSGGTGTGGKPNSGVGGSSGMAPGCKVADVMANPMPNWGDSYSANGKCYCNSTFDHSIGSVKWVTPVGERTIRQICDAIGPGPGVGHNPVYNDIQCGHGPPYDSGDETWCPGRTDQGRDGCCTMGPAWDLSVVK